MLENLENKAARGSISQIILTALSNGSKYGYEICKDIEKITAGKLILKQPSLYSCLRRMEEQGLIVSYWQDSDLGGKRHYYSLTSSGKELFEKNKNIWKNEEELINCLPENINTQESVIEDEKESEITSSFTSVVNQENLFNLARKQEEIKKINDCENDEENKQAFLQFDFFDQNIKHVKSSEKTNIQDISSFTNKFSDLDNHSSEIEPVEKNDEPIVENIEINSVEITDDKTELISTNIIFATPETTKNETNENSSVLSKNEKEENSVLNTEENVELEKITWEISKNNNVTDSTTPLFENKDYKTAIGELYNNSQLKDPYEQNKFRTFKEIFPQSQLKNKEKNITAKNEDNSKIEQIVKANKESNINCDDIKMLNNLYNLQGINIKIHKDIENKRQNKVYTDKNKLNMVTSWIITLIALFSVISTYFILKNKHYIVSGQTIVYFLSVALMLSYCLIQTLENIFDRFKLVKITTSFKKSFTSKLLLAILIIIGVFAINLAFGMTHLLQREYLSFWVVPSLMALNIILHPIIYYILLNSKNFNS